MSTFMNRRTLFTLSIATALAFAPSLSSASERCEFSKTLELGTTGEEIRCLQRYLNANGHTVADSGVGSVGNETSLYREKTKDAVRRWQIANGITPATGNFGPLSQAKYASLVDTYVPSVPSVPNTAAPADNESPAEETVSGKKNAARKMLLEARAAYDDALDVFRDADKDNRRTGSAEDNLEDALDDLLRGYEEFLSEDYAESRKSAEDSIELSDAAEDEIETDSRDTRSEKKKIEDAIEQAREDIDDARDEVEEADDDNRDTNDAEDLLDEAEEKVDEAEEAFDDEDFDEVDDLLDEADDLIDEALDEIED
jgi:peptidoglycan hydrolase-like protein with peptidoglycan-binding domain